MTFATLDATDLTVIVVTVLCLGAAVAATVAAIRLAHTLGETRRTVAELRVTTETLLAELADLTAQAGRDFERVDDLIGSAEALASTVDSAARVGYLTMGKPVIKTVAFAKGTSRAARRMRPPKVG